MPEDVGDKLWLASCVGVDDRVKPPDTVWEGEALGVTEDEGLLDPDDERDWLLLAERLGVGVLERVTSWLAVITWLGVDVGLGDATLVAVPLDERVDDWVLL